MSHSLITDWFTGDHIDLLETNNEVVDRSGQYRWMIKNLHKMKMRTLHRDNRDEYMSRDLPSTLLNTGHQLLTEPRTPRQNWMAERMNRTLLNTTRAQLIELGIANELWPGIVVIRLHIRKKCSSRAADRLAAKVLLLGKGVKLSHLRVLRCSYGWLVTASAGRQSSTQRQWSVLVGHPKERKNITDTIISCLFLYMFTTVMPVSTVSNEINKQTLGLKQ